MPNLVCTSHVVLKWIVWINKNRMCNMSKMQWHVLNKQHVNLSVIKHHANKWLPKLHNVINAIISVLE